jgi:PAS domain-containing protein
MNGSKAGFTATPHPDPDPSKSLAPYQRTAVRTLLLTLSFCTSLVALAIYRQEGPTPLWWTTSALCLFLWTAHVLFHRGREILAVNLIVTAMMVSSILAIVMQGSMRSAAVLVMIATVICAGTLLNARPLIVTAVICITSLAGLNAAENMGWLRRNNLDVGLAVWITQSAVLIIALVCVYCGRRLLTDALSNQQQALNQGRHVEAQLRSSEGRFIALFRNNPAATLVQRAKTQEVLEVNEAFVRMFDLSPEDLTKHQTPRLRASASDQARFQSQLETAGRVDSFRSSALRQDGLQL